MVGHVKETGHSVFKGVSDLNRGIQKKNKVAGVLRTSMRIRRTQNSCFAQTTQQISSVSTQQFQAGVKS